MSDNERILDRIQKLIRVAVPTSGATLPERESAALEVVKLIHEHDIPVGAKVAPPRPRQSPRRASQRQAPPSWVRVRAPCDGLCHECLEPFYRGDVVFFKPSTGTIYHEAWPCDE